MYYGTAGRLGSWEGEHSIAGYFGGAGNPMTGVPSRRPSKSCSGNTYVGTLMRQNNQFILLSGSGNVTVTPGNGDTAQKMYQMTPKMVKVCGVHGANGIVANSIVATAFAWTGVK